MENTIGLRGSFFFSKLKREVNLKIRLKNPNYNLDRMTVENVND